MLWVDGLRRARKPTLEVAVCCLCALGWCEGGVVVGCFWLG